MVRRTFFLALLVAGLLIPAWGARLAAADSSPEWITFTPVCTVRYVTPNGEWYVRTGVTSVDLRYQSEKGIWDQIRFPGEQRTIPVTLVQTPPCP